MYPVLCEGTTIGSFRYEGEDAIRYFAENERGEQYEISKGLCNALLAADGTGPLRLPDKGRAVLPFLKKNKIVRTTRFVCNGLFNRFILIRVGRVSRKAVSVCKILNSALPVLSAVLFAISVILMISCGFRIESAFNGWLFCGLVMCSVSLHEIGHLIAGISYGYKIYDVGISLFGVLPTGAYVSHKDKKDAKKSEKIQFALAGVEMNALAAAVFTIAAVCSTANSLTLISAAVMNVIISAANLLPAGGLDGEFVLGAVCGLDNKLGETAKEWLSDKRLRRELLSYGKPGYICLSIFSISYLSKILYFMLTGIDILTIVIWSFDFIITIFKG